jgi:phosphoribosylformimino-5-aminoimidazole carboxamide ribotide isomerase
MRIIPAIDVAGNRCVRLSQGDFMRKRCYTGDPLSVARQLEDHGIQYLHLVDLDGALEGQIRNFRMLETIAAKTSLKVDFSGGIRTDDDIHTAFRCGASQVICGSIAVNDPALFLKWMTSYGPDKIILGADFRDGKVATAGWTDTTENDLVPFLKHFRSQGIQYVVCTDIEKDGMLEGPSVDIYKEIVQISGLSLIASGGVSSTEDIRILRETGCEGVIIGKAIYEGRITLKELTELC